MLNFSRFTTTCCSNSLECLAKRDSSATEMAKLADLFYETNRDGNAKLDAKRNFNSRGNRHFKPKYLSMPNVNSESSKNFVNAVTGDKKPE